MIIKSLFDDRVLIKPQAGVDKTKGGIIIPENIKEKPNRGVVILVGKNKDGSDLPLVPGDKVVYGKFAGTEIDDERHGVCLIMRITDIFGNYELGS